MAREQIERSDVAGLLLHAARMRRRALGTARGRATDEGPGDLATDDVPLGDLQLANIGAAGTRTRRLPADVQDPSPLAGVQSKIALTRLPDGRLAKPRPGRARRRRTSQGASTGQQRDVDREYLARPPGRERMPTANVGVRDGDDLQHSWSRASTGGSPPDHESSRASIRRTLRRRSVCRRR